jgi:hypothetical protein
VGVDGDGTGGAETGDFTGAKSSILTGGFYILF